MTAKRKVFVAMSGGVDSSVAALLLRAKPSEFEKLTGRPAPKELRDQGYDVTGVFMRCWSGDNPDASVGASCAWERDAADARRVAAHLGIPFYVWDFEEEYKKRVAEYMIEGYRQGITPNPDVMCNKEIKFGLFLEKALSLGAGFVATGHYVRLLRAPASRHRVSPRSSGSAHRYALGEKSSDRGRRNQAFLPSRVAAKQGDVTLYTARDANKDQSYFLWTLTQNQLASCLFPISDYLKSEVREIARKAGLPTAEKKDSQGICFLGKVTLADFLKDYIPVKRGAALTTAGKKIGEHDGAKFYTIGQRHVGVGGLPKPHYVAEKDVKTNTIVVAEEGSPNLYRKEVKITDINFLNPITSYQLPITIYARVRYRQPLTEAKLVISNSKLGNPITNYQLLFTKPVKFVAPGQSAVFYSKDGEMLGGGVIL